MLFSALVASYYAFVVSITDKVFSARIRLGDLQKNPNLFLKAGNATAKSLWVVKHHQVHLLLSLFPLQKKSIKNIILISTYNKYIIGVYDYVKSILSTNVVVNVLKVNINYTGNGNLGNKPNGRSFNTIKFISKLNKLMFYV